MTKMSEFDNFKGAFRYLIEQSRHTHGEDHCPLRGYCKSCKENAYCILAVLFP